MTLGRPAASNALVPLRFFLGGTFLYAGLDKLVSPTFFLSGAPGSIQEQLNAFARTSPLGPLLHLVLPFAALIGFAIALTEVAIGLGALSGYGFRVAAVGGAALAGLFWLTASWATHPYYYGPDLPYLAGWITLALAGHGNVLVPDRFKVPDETPPARRRDAGHPARRLAGPVPRKAAAAGSAPADVTRRAVLQAGVLGAAATVVALVSAPLRGVFGLGSSPGASRSPTPTPAPSFAPSPEPTEAGTPTPGIAVAALADLAASGAVAFRVPFDAPLPLPAGDPGVIVRLEDGSYAAFDALCTHAGCTVEWDSPDRLLICPCHGAVFDPARDGAVLEGPTDLPLTALPLVLDVASGTFRLRIDG